MLTLDESALSQFFDQLVIEIREILSTEMQILCSPPNLGFGGFIWISNADRILAATITVKNSRIHYVVPFDKTNQHTYEFADPHGLSLILHRVKDLN